MTGTHELHCDTLPAPRARDPHWKVPTIVSVVRALNLDPLIICSTQLRCAGLASNRDAAVDRGALDRSLLTHQTGSRGDTIVNSNSSGVSTGKDGVRCPKRGPPDHDPDLILLAVLTAVCLMLPRKAVTLKSYTPPARHLSSTLGHGGISPTKYRRASSARAGHIAHGYLRICVPRGKAS